MERVILNRSFPQYKYLILFLLFVCAGSIVLGSDPVRFKLAGLKLLPVQWDKEANFAKLEKWVRQAAAAGAEMIVTPEGYLDGYVANRNITRDLTRERYFAVGEPMDGPWIQKARALASQLEIYLVLGFAERRGDQMFNTAIMISPSGEVLGDYSKAHTAGGEPFNSAGSRFPVFSTPLGRIGLLICFDRQLPETSRILAVKGAQIILVPAFGLGTSEINEDVMMRTRAYENGVYVAHVHPRNTFVVDPKGNIVSQSRSYEEEIVMATITLDDRIGQGPITQRRPDIYGEILK